MRSILNGVMLTPVHWARVYDPTVVEGNHHLEQEVCVAAGCALVQMHVTDWAEAQKEDLTLSIVLNWEATEEDRFGALLAEHASSEEVKLILWNWQNFMIHQEALYLHSMPKGETEDLLPFRLIISLP